MNRTVIFALLLGMLAGQTGCRSASSLFRGERRDPPPATAQLSETASLQEILAVVNRNLEKIQNFTTTNATLAGSGIFNLRGEIAFQRPALFRLRGSHAVSGAELDVGRNQEISWIWVGKQEPKAIYYVRNDEYANSDFAKDLPIDPTWMIDALGFGMLDPNLPYEGPFPVDASHVELRIKDSSESGNQRTRVIVINRVRGLPAAQRIYDKYDTLSVDSRVTSYHTDSHGITIPQTVEIRCPKEQDGRGMMVQINFGTPTLNQLDPKNTHLWLMPQFPGYAPQNMASRK